MSENQKLAVAAAEKVKTVKEMFADAHDDLMALIPKHVKGEQLLQIAQSAVIASPELMACTASSLMHSIATATQLDLSLHRGLSQAALVPRNGVCSLQIEHRGRMALCLRHPHTRRISFECVYANDVFSVSYGDSPRLTHEPPPNVFADRGKVVGYYAIAFLADGATTFKMMSVAQITKHMNQFCLNAQGKIKDVWRDNLDEMSLKTCIMKLCARLPMSELATQVTAQDPEAQEEPGDGVIDVEFSQEPETQPLPEPEPVAEHVPPLGHPRNAENAENQCKIYCLRVATSAQAGGSLSDTLFSAREAYRAAAYPGKPKDKELGASAEQLTEIAIGVALAHTGVFSDKGLGLQLFEIVTGVREQIEIPKPPVEHPEVQKTQAKARKETAMQFARGIGSTIEQLNGRPPSSGVRESLHKLGRQLVSAARPDRVDEKEAYRIGDALVALADAHIKDMSAEDLAEQLYAGAVTEGAFAPPPAKPKKAEAKAKPARASKGERDTTGEPEWPKAVSVVDGVQTWSDHGGHMFSAEIHAMGDNGIPLVDDSGTFRPVYGGPSVEGFHKALKLLTDPEDEDGANDMASMVRDDMPDWLPGRGGCVKALNANLVARNHGITAE